MNSNSFLNNLTCKKQEWKLYKHVEVENKEFMDSFTDDYHPAILFQGNNLKN